VPLAVAKSSEHYPSGVSSRVIKWSAKSLLDQVLLTSVVDVSRKEVKGAGEESSLAYQIRGCDRLEDKEDKRATVHGSMDGASIDA